MSGDATFTVPTVLVLVPFVAAAIAPAWFLWRLMRRFLLTFQAEQIELLTQRLGITETAFGVIHVYERNSKYKTTCCGALLVAAWRRRQDHRRPVRRDVH